MKREIEAFIKNFVKDLAENNVAIFAGAGMSKSAGFVDWPGLLSDIANELGLNIEKEHDLISLAQYHVNEKQNNYAIRKKILEEFSEDAIPTENHEILARLPISTYWTTNYDTLIETSIKNSYKIPDVKHEVKQLTNTRPKRDVVVYKMHGDVQHPGDAILTKEQYEIYYKTHEPFIAALCGDLVSKTFLFIGFSFTDPNLDYVLSRLNLQFGKDKRQHYFFIKKPIFGEPGNIDNASFDYNTRKHDLRIGELKRYGIQALEIEKYSEITDILKEIEFRYRKRTIFISGSAEEYGKWSKDESQEFIHLLSKKIVKSNFRVVNGFGWGVGSAVINGALEAIYEQPEKFNESQLIIKPFPQFKTGDKDLKTLWEEYRQKMISLAGIAIYIFGNKINKTSGTIINANGVRREFEISIDKGLIPIPIAVTGYEAKDIFDAIMKDSDKYYKEYKWIPPIINEMAKLDLTDRTLINRIIEIIRKINR